MSVLKVEQFCEECSGINGYHDFKCSRYVTPKASALNSGVREADVADIIAGALGTSRAHAYQLMREAIKKADEDQ